MLRVRPSGLGQFSRLLPQFRGRVSLHAKCLEKAANIRRQHTIFNVKQQANSKLAETKSTILAKCLELYSTYTSELNNGQREEEGASQHVRLLYARA